MKNTIIGIGLSLALCASSAPAQISTNSAGFVNTNTFALRMSRPATAAEVSGGTNTTAWVSPSTLQNIRPYIVDASTTNGWSILGPLAQWDEVQQWTRIGPISTNSLLTITYPFPFTNNIRYIQTTVLRVGESSGGGPVVTCQPVEGGSPLTNILVRVLVSTPFAGGDYCYALIRVWGK